MYDDLYPHQKEAILKLKNGNILLGGVGTGKTRVALAYYMEKETPKNIYVFTTGKKRDSLDWMREADKFGISNIITVDSFNNIGKYIDIKNSFVVLDEQRLIGKGAWVKSFLKISRANRWIMLSATPGDVWLDYCPVFIANGFYENRTEFVREHVVYKAYRNFPVIDRYIGLKKLNRQRDQILVEMPYQSHTIRNSKDIYVEYDHEDYKMVERNRWHIYEDRPIKDVAEQYRLKRKIVNTDLSRLQEVKILMKKHPKLIIFYNYNYELEMLKTLENEITLAEYNGHKHDEIPSMDSWVYLVQYMAGAESWECIETDAMVFWSLPYAYRLFYQAHGRIDRLNTPYTDLYYYILRSDSSIDKEILESLNDKKNFNEKDNWDKHEYHF